MLGEKTKEAQEAFGRRRAIASRLVAEAPGEASYRFTLADLRNNQGVLLLAEAMPSGQAVTEPGKLKECQAAHREALELRRQLVQAEPGNPDYKAYLAASFNHLGNTFQVQGTESFAKAEANYREALALLEPLAVAFPGVPSHRQEMAQIFNNLNQLFATQKRWVEAEALGRTAVERFSRLAKSYPTVPEDATELGVALEQLASTLRRQGKADAAGEQGFAAAVAFAQASALVTDPAQREARASKAVALLQQARRDGYFKDTRRVESLRREPAFQILWPRSDYSELLANLGRK